MTPRHANRGPDGKFVRADGKATLHRQVSEELCRTARERHESAGAWALSPPAGTQTPDPHGPRIELSWPLVFFVAGLVLVFGMGVWLMGVDGGLW